MQEEFWRARWETNDIQFHLPDIYPPLVTYANALPKGKILVPLCGKSLDMLWLLAEGYHVVGAELSSIACEAFFLENKLLYCTLNQDGFTVYKGQNIELWCGNFFKLPKAAWQGVTAIYDRAALFALPVEMRKQYAEFIKQSLATDSDLTMLLVTVEYPDDRVQGPPFVVTEAEITQVYSDMFVVTRLPPVPESGFNKHPKFQNIPITDHLYLLKKSNH